MSMIKFNLSWAWNCFYNPSAWNQTYLELHTKFQLNKISSEREKVENLFSRFQDDCLITQESL